MADLLVDEGIGRDLVQQLRTQGLRIFHALEVVQKGDRDSLVFLEAQRRSLAVFTDNHRHFVLLAHAWSDWGLGDHYGVITRPIGKHQLSPAQTLQFMAQYCADSSSFVNRIELVTVQPNSGESGRPAKTVSRAGRSVAPCFLSVDK